MPPKLTDADARRRMADHGRIVDTPYPGKVTVSWPHLIEKCGHPSRQSFQDVLYSKRGCQPCSAAARAREHLARVEQAERAAMIENGVMPDPDVPFPGANEPWRSWCLKPTCGYGKDLGPRWTPNSTSIKSGASRCPNCSGRRRWTHEEAAAYIARFGVTPLEEYPGVAKADWHVRCAQGHEYWSSFERIREKQSRRCRVCSRNMPHTAVGALAVFRALGLEPDPAINYPGYDIPWPSTCTQCDHRCETVRLSTVMQGHGCKPCNAIRRYADPAKISAELAEWGFSMVAKHPYPGPKKRWLVQHDRCGKTIERTMAAMRYGFRGCWHCGDRSGGLDRSKPCFVYVLVKERATNNRDAVKVGGAGCESVYDRIAHFTRKGWHLHWRLDFDTGHEAEAVERSIHALLREETGQTSQRGFIPRADMPNGYSETYSRDEVPEAYLRTLVEEQAAFYRDLFQVATAKQLT